MYTQLDSILCKDSVNFESAPSGDTRHPWGEVGPWPVVLVSSAPATKETGGMGREIVSLQGIGW
jgi:hypothetical protein